MPHSSFNDMNVGASIIALIFGIWGAILNFTKRNIRGVSFVKKLSLFFIDMLINVGITILIYIGLIGYGFNDLLSVSIAGFLGHQGNGANYCRKSRC